MYDMYVTNTYRMHAYGSDRHRGQMLCTVSTRDTAHDMKHGRVSSSLGLISLVQIPCKVFVGCVSFVRGSWG